MGKWCLSVVSSWAYQSIHLFSSTWACNRIADSYATDVADLDTDLADLDTDLYATQITDLSTDCGYILSLVCFWVLVLTANVADFVWHWLD